jgi:hypothetical protein
VLRATLLRALPLVLLLAPRSALAEERPLLVELLLARDRSAALLTPAAEALARSPNFRIVHLRALLPLMREADSRERIQQEVVAAVEEGRKALVALDHERASTLLAEALRMAQRSYLRYHDPATVANIRLLLGVVAMQRARPDLARPEFVELLQLQPDFKLDAHYSPQVRASFAEAAKLVPPSPPSPSSVELRKIVELAGARGAVVLGAEPADGTTLLKGALYLLETDRYAAVESRLALSDDPALARQRAVELGEVLRATGEKRFPRQSVGPRPPPPRPHPLPPPPPPNNHWYQRWYLWAGVGLVLATLAVAIPVGLREKYDRGTVSW